MFRFYILINNKKLNFYNYNQIILDNYQTTNLEKNQQFYALIKFLPTSLTQAIVYNHKFYN